MLRILDQARFPSLWVKDSPIPPGIARHVIHALETLSRRGLDPMSEGSGLIGLTGPDLEAVRLKLAETLKVHRLLDPTEVLRSAAEALREGSVSLPENSDLLLLDGFAAPDKIEADFLCELVRSPAVARAVVTLPEPVVDLVQSNGWDDLPLNSACIGMVKDFSSAWGSGRLEVAPQTTASATLVSPPVVGVS